MSTSAWGVDHGDTVSKANAFKQVKNIGRAAKTSAKWHAGNKTHWKATGAPNLKPLTRESRGQAVRNTARAVGRNPQGAALIGGGAGAAGAGAFALDRKRKGVSKAQPNNDQRKYGKTSAVLGATLGAPGAGVHAGVTAKKGKKLRAIGNAGGGSLVGGTAGAVVGGGLTRGSRAGSFLGGTVGGGVGAAYGAGRNLQRGYVKKSDTSSVWGVEHVEKKFDASKPYTNKDREKDGVKGYAAGAAAGALAPTAAVRGASAANAGSGMGRTLRLMGSSRKSALGAGARVAGSAIRHTKGPGLFAATMGAAVGGAVGAAAGDAKGKKRYNERRAFQRKG